MRSEILDVDSLTLFAAVSEPMVVHDGVQVVWANEAARHLLGTPARSLRELVSAPILIDGRARVASLVEPPAQNLERKDRLELLALISAGLAHDLDGPLMVLSVQTSALARALHLVEKGAAEELGALPERLRAGLRACAGALENLDDVSLFLARMVRDFGRLSRGLEPARPVSCDLRHAVETAARLSRTLLLPRATLEVEVAEAATLAISEDALVRVLMNLILNAAQAFASDSPATNRIEVRAARVADGIVLDVTDNAGGLSTQAVERLFVPFAAGARDGKTAGLGLAVARALLREAGGDLTLRGTGPQGTTFRCHLRAR